MVGEPERKVRVQALINQLADESLENRQAAYAELRDTFVRKRDIPELTKEIARNANPEVTMSLRNLITFIEGRWRLPDKGWTTDISECRRCYEKEFQDLGCDLAVVFKGGGMGEYLLTLDVDVPEVPIENRTGVINLILTLEPESLMLWGSWGNITFLGTLANLEKLHLGDTKVADLTPLKGLPRLRYLELGDTKVTDLTPLKGLPNLAYLHLQNTGVSDLTPLKGMPKLKWLDLQDTGVTDLTPLKGLPNLEYLHLENTKVADLTPLKGLPKLHVLDLENTKVTDLTPLKGMPDLMHLHLQNTGVTDLTPLKGLPSLRYLYLQNTKVTDLTPLKGMPGLTIFEK
jgi:Leucine-rich repeat (LRR) protein